MESVLIVKHFRTIAKAVMPASLLKFRRAWWGRRATKLAERASREANRIRILESNKLEKKRTDTSHLEVLLDPSFQASVEEVRDHTLLDTARLANLWQLCRWSNPEGAIIEVGAYKGGSALHLSNSCPQRRIYVCDTFEGFGALPIDPKHDRLFSKEHFSDTSHAWVQSHWAGKNRDLTWVRGYFPQSAANLDISNISFAHLDVDLYQSTIDTLEHLNDRFIEGSIIVLDDYLRNVDGVMRAVKEFQYAHRGWTSFPMYPGQGLMIHESWFNAESTALLWQRMKRG
jgi:Macrocin-O-methyltransferase (TylF)